MKQTILILGTSGKAGTHSANAFARAGWTVKSFDRRRDKLSESARDVDVIMNGFNPPNYRDWEHIVPEITKEVIAAARTSGASVLLPGNVYHFGDQSGIWSERSTPNPVSRKGMIRLKMENEYRESGVQTIILRAGNFIDPLRNHCVMSEIYLRNIKRGKITLPGAKDIGQAMCYLPDWARAAVALTEMRATLSQFEDIPFAGYYVSAEQIKATLETVLGQNLTYSNFPWWLFRLSAPVWELAQEMNDMRYLWNTDHRLSNERFRSLLPSFVETPLAEALHSSLPETIKPMTPSQAQKSP